MEHFHNIYMIITTKNIHNYERKITITRNKTILNNSDIQPADDLQPNSVVICCLNKRYDGYDSNGNILNKKIPVYNNERLRVIRQTTNANGKIKLDLQKLDGSDMMVKNITNIVVDATSFVQPRYLFTIEKSETTYKHQGMTITEPRRNT